MKKNKLKLFFPIVLIIISFALGIYFYPSLPEKMASHWGFSGQVDGYSSKNFGVFFLPGLLVFLLILFSVLPKTDPYKTNFSQFKKYFENFINIVFVFLIYLYSLTLVWNLGYGFNLIQFITPGFGLIFYYAGVLMQNTKRNWFVGIRTPWTLSSEVVWEKTHKLGARLFKASGLISLLGIILPSFALLFILAPILLVTVFILAYSYFEYQKINHQ
jgi:uncharacterized membrane protein